MHSKSSLRYRRYTSSYKNNRFMKLVQ